MNLEDIVAVSGLPGLFKVVGNRANGLIVSDIDTGKSRFCSMRKHQFTPLQTAAVYTDLDTVELEKVFGNMLASEGELPVPSHKDPSSALINYFAQVLPEYDRDRVLISDIKKIIKWFHYLKQRDMLKPEDQTETDISNESDGETEFEHE